MPVSGKGGFLTLDIRSPSVLIQAFGPIIELKKTIRHHIFKIGISKSIFPDLLIN